ncbi:response regulator [Myxococcota bacterium]|nr:response regulator [Myxococcota bacterium]
MPRILVVERSAVLRSRLSGVLADLMPAAKIVEVATGFEALRTLPLQVFDLLVVDVRLPDIDGCDFLGFVKSHRNYLGIPLVLISDDAFRIDRIAGIRVEAWLRDPFEDEEIQDILAEFLEDSTMAQILSDSTWAMEA